MLRMQEVEIPLRRVFALLETIPAPKPELTQKRLDLPCLDERLENAGLEVKADKTEEDKKAKPPPPPIPLEQALREAQHMAMLGEAGAGKSTTLQFIGLSFAAATGGDGPTLELEESRVPVLVRLGSLPPAFGPG